MSKSPNVLLPILGLAGLVLGVVVALPSRGHLAGDVASAMQQTLDAEARVAAAQAKIGAQKMEFQQAMATAASAPLDTGAPAPAGLSLGLGRQATGAEVAAWDIDVRPDGLGLPVGSGDVWTGEEVFVERCAACHGDFGEAVGRWPVLAGGQNTLSDEDPVKTIGSYWPYLSTVYDYVYRAMPFGEAQSLTHDEVYAITAYLLYLNDMVEDDFELSDANFADIRLPNEGNFFPDDRAETELITFSAEPCMENCKDGVEITMRASVLDVTPMDETEEPVSEGGGTELDANAALVTAGEGLFRQCQSCHAIGDGARNGTGPHLNGVVGRTIGQGEGFRYSTVLSDAGASGRVWSTDELSKFLADPRAEMPGTKMAFRGVRDDTDIAALIAYISSFSE